jgi:hypothetical protein
VNPTTSDEDQIQTDVQPLHNVHGSRQNQAQQGIESSTGDHYHQNSLSHYGHDTYDYKHSQYHYGHDLHEFQNYQYQHSQNVQPDFLEYDYSVDQDVEYEYVHNQQNNFQYQDNNFQNQQNDFQTSQNYQFPEYDYSVDEDVEYVSTNESIDQECSDEEKSSESSDSSDDEDNPLLQVPENVFWDMPPIPKTAAPFKPPSKPL